MNIRQDCRRKGEHMRKKVLDACCGSKMFWFNKSDPNVVYQDNRKFETNLSDGRKLIINPDIVGDFRHMDFEDNQFSLIIFDPPHLLRAGKDSWLDTKYGKLNRDSWKEDIKKGFEECWRVLDYNGTLIFKWNEDQIKLKEILEICPFKPLFGNKRAKTHWLVFFKSEGEE